MRLINTKTLQLTEFMGDVPPYAILSHTWEDQEITFHDLTRLTHADLSTKKPHGFAKVVITCRLAAERDKLDWAWVDTCCIDKSSSSELTEAINSMFSWYSKSTICYVYLSDFHPHPTALSDHSPSLSTNKTDDPVLTHLSQCKWFSRGWTLQELIAPQQITFLTSSWHPLGTKLSLSTHLSSITKISQPILLYTQSLSSISVAQRLSWASSRKTTRPEDTAYSLLGLFSVHMPLLYGEGGTRAFIRLQEEIIKETNDLSLFAWKIPPSLAEQPDTSRYWGVLSPTPAYFASSHDIELWGDPMHNSECVWTSRGLKITPVAGGGLSFGARPTYLLNLQCHRKDKIGHLWILLEQHGCDVYVRVEAHLIREDRGIFTHRSRVIYIKKIVTEGNDKSLRESHKYAVDFTSVIATMKTVNMGLYLDDKILDHEGYWDHQRSLWLMQGGRNGRSILRFGPRAVTGSGNLEVWVGCDVY
ncbi:HET-domain-containing protein, partial [Rhypophila decipiens]